MLLKKDVNRLRKYRNFTKFYPRFFTVLLALLGLNVHFVQGQNLSAEQKPNSKAIAYFELPNSQLVYDITAYGADDEGLIACDSVLNSLLQSSNSDLKVIYFPKGKYKFNQSIRLNSHTILRGADADSTELLFDLKGKGHCIEVRGTSSGNYEYIDQTFAKGTNSLQVTSGVEPGEILMLSQNDSSWITSSWATNSVGQFVEVAEQVGGQLILKTSIRHDYFKSLNPRISRPNFVTNVGIENLKIRRSDATSSQTSNMFFQYATSCWVYGVYSDSCNFAHVTFDRCYKNLATGCHFENSFDYGGGGKGYGIVLQNTSSDHVVENNVLRHLRHSILLQAGANGNIVGYNYSREPFWEGTFFPSSFAGDLVLHGNYVYANLFEGNVVQNIVIDNSHGMNGPRNSFLRNRAEHAGIYMNASQVSDSQNFIGNEITSSGFQTHNGFRFPKGLYSLAGKGHIEYGNNHNGKMLPNTIEQLDASFYLNHAPNFWNINAAWPSIGFPNDLGAQKIPAQIRFEAGKLTVSRKVFEPVKKFEKLAAKQSNNTILLQWELQSASQHNVFEVREFDPIQNEYVRMGEVSQAQIQGSTAHYQFIDYAPQTGENSYRIIQKNAEGLNLFTEETSLDFKQTSSIHVANEIGTRTFWIEQGLGSSSLKIELYSTNGQMVKDFVLSGDEISQAFDLEGLKSGVYLLKIHTENRSSTQKIQLW